MNYRLLSAWALLLALAAVLAIWPIGEMSTSVIEDRNFDGQADVWQFYDEDGRLVKVTCEGNFDGYVDSLEGMSGRVAAAPDVTFNAALQPFLLPRVMFVGDQPIEERAPVSLEARSQALSAASVSGRAPPAAL